MDQAVEGDGTVNGDGDGIVGGDRGGVEAFYRDLTVHDRFEAMTRAENYRPMPNSWWLGAADIAGSTDLVARGRYKQVNTIGAAVICAQVNGIAQVVSSDDLPFVFGGDGAVFAVPPGAVAESRAALAAMRRWAGETHGVTLRAAMRSVADIRADGHDVRIARFGAGAVSYAMFEGGGARALERDMKAGLHTVESAPPDAVPDLTGLSCRWQPVEARHGHIVSLIVQPMEGADEAALDRLYARVNAIARGLERDGHPLPQGGPSWPLVARNLELERANPHTTGGRLRRTLHALAMNAFAWGLDRTDRKAGRFDPKHYARVLATNADFRKISDGLMMTLDCDAATLDTLRGVLEEAREAGLARFGIAEGDEAIVTCIVPSPVQDDHIHFVDGADGGYTLAAEQLEID